MTAAQNLPAVFTQALSRPLGRARLLAAIAAYRGRQLGWSNHIWQEVEVPAAQERSGAGAQILAQGVRLPAADCLQAGAPPDTCCSVKLGEQARAVAHCLLNNEMLIECDSLDAGQG